MSSGCRYDDRAQTYTVSNTDGVIVNVDDLQVTGVEPIMMSVTGADITIRYGSSDLNAGITILDGSVVTWELANPFRSQVFITTVDGAASSAEVQFFITGGIQSGQPFN